MAPRYITIDYMIYDSVLVRPGQQVQVFVDRTDAASQAAISIAEPQLIDTLLNVPQVRQFLLSKWSLSNTAVCKTRVVRPFLEDPTRKPGDIDVFAVDTQKPHEAVASEWKRIKVRAGTSEFNQRVNGLEGANDGVLQVNALATMEFSRTWLSLLVIADGRDRKDVNMAFRGPTGRTVGRIYDFAQGFRVDPDVGICVVESVQTTHSGINNCGAVGFGVIRQPRFRTQSSDLTSKVANFVRDLR